MFKGEEAYAPLKTSGLVPIFMCLRPLMVTRARGSNLTAVFLIFTMFAVVSDRLHEKRLRSWVAKFWCEKSFDFDNQMCLQKRLTALSG